jgi:hypothetical protein
LRDFRSGTPASRATSECDLPQLWRSGAGPALWIAAGGQVVEPNAVFENVARQPFEALMFLASEIRHFLDNVEEADHI